MNAKFTLALLLLSYAVSAQDSSFQIKDYKYRTPGYRALVVGFNFSGNYNKTKTSNNEDSRNRYLNLGPVSVSYSKLISTETRQHQSIVVLQPAAGFSGSSYNGKEAHTGQFAPSFSWNRSDRFYRENGWFWEAGNQLSASYYTQSIKDTLYRYKNKSLDVQDNLILGVGKGRIEYVQDAQMAMYILQDLSAQNLLTRPPTADEARLLAQLVTDINNKRVFDFRRRRIYELTRLDSFLRNSGLAPQTDIRHFTTLNDNWALAFNPTRLSGASWYLRVQPGVHYQRSTSNNFTPAQASSLAENTFLNLMPVIGYENDRPLNLRWQRNFSVSLAYAANRATRNSESSSQGNTDKTSTTANNWSSSINALYGIGFYPNNRTLVNGSLNVTGYYNKIRDVSLLSVLQFDAQYFISYRTYLMASAYVRYNYLNQLSVIQSHDFSAGLSVSLSHVIF